MAGKVILGRHTILKVVYNNTPYSFRLNSFEEDDNGELRSRSHLGQTREQQDYIQKNWGGSLTVAEDGPALDTIAADIQARDNANLPPRELLLTLTKVYRDGSTLPVTVTYGDVVMKVGQSIGGRTDDVTRKVAWQAGSRTVT